MTYTPHGNKISHHEFNQALFHLKEQAGFSHHQIEKIKETFNGHLSEEGAGHGISQHELTKGIERLKEHNGEHRFEEHHIEHIEKTFGHYL